ncbi:hypothetical protein [Paraburkholderia sp. Ac-20347]|uniref:DUF7660 family protein n=1 Tax=Paraburkholderia sp. Ac-20347 TaxID=2703892 RepID=UPI001981FFB2|nr:hypothetical protein [Paraburkholderia sp. Ac-20347]MBN3809669.1 hypothetical protein [Paraburkholderia sp. Ac-20347]
MKIDERRVAEIKTREDFVEFMAAFVKSIKSGRPVENNTVESYLDAVASWVEAMDGYYENMGIANEVRLDTMNWRVLADILIAATMYE